MHLGNHCTKAILICGWSEFLDIRKKLISFYRDRTPCEDNLYGFYNGQLRGCSYFFCEEGLLWLISYALFLLGML